MTEGDEKRLAEIRSMKRHQLLTYSDVRLLLRLLDTERAEKAHYKRVAEANSVALTEETARGEARIARATQAESARERVGKLESAVEQAASRMQGAALAMELSEQIDAAAFAQNLRIFADKARAALTPETP